MQWQAPSVIKVVLGPLFCFCWFWLRKERQQLGWSKSETCSIGKEAAALQNTSAHCSAECWHRPQRQLLHQFCVTRGKRSNPPTNSSRVNFPCSFGSNEDSKNHEFGVMLPINVIMTPYQIWVIQGSQLPNTLDTWRVFFTVRNRLLSTSLVLCSILKNTKQKYLYIYYFQPY